MNKPRAVEILIKEDDSNTFRLDEEALNNVLSNDDIKDRNAVVISIAGALRGGKSFLLSFFLKYLRSKYVMKEDSSEWLGPDDAPLEGFPWRGGSERETTGILMWSEIFLADLPNGEKVAIFLLDTQGTWDTKSTVRECATIFALSTLISSVQIYNLSRDIQEDDLQHLQLFTEYGNLVLEKSQNAPFQKLLCLIRDWMYPYEAEYGSVGGQQILKKRLGLNKNLSPDLKYVRKHIQSLFTTVDCFLMPHPGLGVAGSQTFRGNLAEIEDKFKDHMKDLVTSLLAPENLVLKKIEGQNVKARNLIKYFKSYMKIFEGNELPEPKSILQATAEANHLSAVSDAKSTYWKLMEEICGGSKPHVDDRVLEEKHLKAMNEAIMKFENIKKMRYEKFGEKYKLQLKQELQKSFDIFKERNEKKRISKLILNHISPIFTPALNFLKKLFRAATAAWKTFFVIISAVLVGAAYGATALTLGVFPLVVLIVAYFQSKCFGVII